MRDPRRRHVIVYDVIQDKRRNKIARILGGYGERVQYSVFECLLVDKQFEELWKELREVIDESEDSLRAYRLCANCNGWTKTVGRAADAAVPDVYVI